ncbi:hypothetical protein ACFIOY_38815 [Bradyrhizobium sp. TZ2]
MGGAQQGGGAKPEHQDRYRQNDRSEQEAKTGEHGREFRLALVSAGLLMPRERGDHFDRLRGQRIRLIQEYLNAGRLFVAKSAVQRRSLPDQWRFPVR